MQVPIGKLRTVIGSMRTLPIRVGGTSGPGYPDQYELQWSDVGVAPEKTTVTNRDRRIFTYSRQQIEEAIFMCEPDEVFLNFCNYVGQLKVDDIIRHVEACGSQVTWAGYGPRHEDIINYGPITAGNCGVGG